MTDDDLSESEKFRQGIANGAMRAMDQVDEEYVEVLHNFYNCAMSAAVTLLGKGVNGDDVCCRLAGLAADAAFNAARH